MGLNAEEAAQVGWKALQLSSHDLARERVVGELVLVGGRGVPLRREGWMAVRFEWGVVGMGGRQSSRAMSSVDSAAPSRTSVDIGVDK